MNASLYLIICLSVCSLWVRAKDDKDEEKYTCDCSCSAEIRLNDNKLDDYSKFAHPELFTGLSIVSSFIAREIDDEQCAKYCDADDMCFAFVIRPPHICQLLFNTTFLFNKIGVYVYESGDIIYTLKGSNMELLGYRTSEGIADDPYAVYIAVADSGCIVEAVDLSTKLTNTTYKHPLIERLNDLPITKMNLVYRDDTGGINEIKFDGVSAQKMTWFSKGLLQVSPWTDLPTATTDFFSIEGDPQPQNQRHFFINNHYGSCPGDIGWFVLSEAGTNCGWQTKYRVTPTILYSKLTTMINWNDADVGRATDLLVTVEISV